MHVQFRIRNVIDLTLILLLVLLFTSCQEFTISAKMDNDNNSKYLGAAVLWQQTSAEIRGLYYQTFALARMQLEKNLYNHDGDKPPAIVLDLDETVLDNSPYEAMLYRQGESYPHLWSEWIGFGRAQAVPGVKDFLRYTDSLGVDIFYITNRDESSRAGTLKNLQLLELPDALDDHLYMRTDISDKTPRRDQVGEDYEILLLLGDNLGDFDEGYQGLTVDERAVLVDENKGLFGSRYIILPNAMYGEWLGAIYDYDYSKSEKAKKLAEKEILRIFKRPGD